MSEPEDKAPETPDTPETPESDDVEVAAHSAEEELPGCVINHSHPL